ncbi:hypothetical protein Ancab_034963 [Ancistrocladus abbreviatus]
MVVLTEKFSHFSHKLHSKLDHLNHHNHHHHRHHQQSLVEPEWVALEAFQADISDSLRQLFLDSGHGSETISLLWLRQCFKQVQWMNSAFAKLVKDIAYPISKWEAAVADEHLMYSLNLLDLLNLISSSIADLCSSRLSLSHAVSQVENSPSLAIERLKPIEPRNHGDYGGRKEGDGGETICHGKGEVVHQAVMKMKAVALWVCGFLLFVLNGDPHPCSEFGKLAAGYFPSLREYFDLRTWEELMIKGGGGVKELKEVNDAVGDLLAALDSGKGSDESEELERKLKELEIHLGGVEEDVNGLFSAVMERRNQLVDSLRLQMK